MKCFALLLAASIGALAQPIQLPTANRALFEKGGEERFFVGTAGRPWTSGMFGCVRSEGWQMHEGLDIRALARTKAGEPADAVMAAADGTVAYVNRRSGASNYGMYVVLRHVIDGLEVYTLYAHLGAFANGLAAGKAVKAGETIATMGRTTNTRERISKERAHVHFEVNLFLTDRFSTWYRKHHPKEKDEHGIWNGMNFVGLDPRLVLLEQQTKGGRFNLVEFVKSRPELFRAVVRDTSFSFARRYPALIRPNPVAQKEGTAGYEIAFDYNAVPIGLTPRAASEIKGKARFQLLSVDAKVQAAHPCRRLLIKRGASWQLTDRGLNMLDLLTH
jgi:peptidoglycan LD-endopeptidase LytH